MGAITRHARLALAMRSWRVGRDRIERDLARLDRLENTQDLEGKRRILQLALESSDASLACLEQAGKAMHAESLVQEQLKRVDVLVGLHRVASPDVKRGLDKELAALMDLKQNLKHASSEAAELREKARLALEALKRAENGDGP